jgi:hypothetical protein
MSPIAKVMGDMAAGRRSGGGFGASIAQSTAARTAQRAGAASAGVLGEQSQWVKTQ